MAFPKQWDISKALTIASLFHFFHNVGNFCVMPFLTIYFRQLGLSAALVGIVMGVKHIIYVFWAPLCSYLAKSDSKRRVLITASLLLSVGAGILLTFIPPLHKDGLTRYCNVSLPWHNKLTTPGATDLDLLAHNKNISYKMLESPPSTPVMSTITTSMDTTHSVRASKNPPQAIDLSNPLPTNLPQNSITASRSQVLEHTNRVTSTRIPTLNVVNNISVDQVLSGDGNDFLTTEPQPSSTSSVSRNKSIHEKRVRDVNYITDQEAFLNEEHKIFLIILGAVILWEVLAAPLEWTADDSMYEYLDFVDATDRHGKLWIWSYLGACVGSVSITLLIDNLSCFIYNNIPRVNLHFYGYSTFIVVTLLLSFLYPIHASKKTEHANKTMKALGLIGNDGRIILLAVTVFLTGTVGSTTNNFLFWQMQDVGSGELYMGLSIAVALLSEIFLYFFRAKLLKTVSYRWIVTMSLSCMAIQFLYYSFLWTSWAVLPIQVLSAFSNGALWWVINSQAEDIATPGTERSLQLVLHCFSYGCGASIGSFASGFVISSFGLAILYQACCITLVLWTIMFLLIQPRLPHLKKINYSRLLAADNSDMSDSEDEPERDWLVKAMKDENFNRKW
ncbi:major facilitator superfamily domain-containing protein 6-like isoform 2-T7 [Discoglossus pictus]